MKLKIILSFDHELPLGSLETDFEKALFEPTRRTLELADNLNVPFTLFTDILCAYKYKQWDYDGFYKPYSEQIFQTISKKHDVQLHIHPHWLTSNFVDKKVVPSSDFSLSSFKNSKQWTIDSIIKKGIFELQEIYKNYNLNNKIIAYRAGGYNIEPSSDEIFSALINSDIKYDSSIVPGYFFASNLSKIDFCRVPKKGNWYIGKNGDFRKNNLDGILEIPIASKPKQIFEIPTAFKLKKYSNRAPISSGKMIHNNSNISFTDKLKMKFSNRILTFDNYTYSSKYLLQIIDYQIKKNKNQDELIISTCSHPKNMGDYSFEIMENFVRNVRKKYPNTEFTSFIKLYNENFTS